MARKTPNQLTKKTITMNPILYSLLLFPQSFRNGKLSFNIMVLPRNINLFQSYDGLPSFAEADFQFDLKIINSLDGLPLTTSPTIVEQPVIEQLPTQKYSLLKSIIEQMERNDNLRISEDPFQTKDEGFEKAITNLQAGKRIRKYLPHSYRNSHNFTTSRTKFAIIDDEYQCTIKNDKKEYTDESTQRPYISWGKLVAFILRNPKLAEQAGFIYKCSVDLPSDILEKGGWIYTNFGAGTTFENMSAMIYAARIPSLTENRQLFAPVLFPVGTNAFNNVTYDAVIQEAILYNDGFAKIVHGNQPVNQDLLQETDTSNPPLKDVGIRLGWDDEQLTIWGNRQLTQEDEKTGQYIDAPSGVFGYAIDVRKAGETRWFSQNAIQPIRPIDFGNGTSFSTDGSLFELPFEVHPSSHGNTKEEGFWLPMYLASWNGKSIVLPDTEAQEIHQLTEDAMLVDEKLELLDPENTKNVIPKKTFNPFQQDENHHVPLLYGEDYEFRIRLMDISGGSAAIEDEHLNGGQNPIEKVHFKRNVSASQMRISNMEEFFLEQNKTKVDDVSSLENILDESKILRLKRPILSYPSVAYTGKYTDAAQLLIQKIRELPVMEDPEMRPEHFVGLSDPDVNNFRIVVEVKSLEMDIDVRKDGKDCYFELYKKEFSIPRNEEDYNLEAEVEIVYRDFEQLSYVDGFDDSGNQNQLVLPTARHLRLTIIPLIDEELLNNDYASDFIAEGKPTMFTTFQPAFIETNILPTDQKWIKAIYLQPETEKDLPVYTQYKKIQVKTVGSSTSAELKRLAEELNLVANNTTLEAEKGKRVQFGISKGFRHSLSPDSSSVSFSSNRELLNKWIVALDFPLKRDWGWDALEIDSFTIYRETRHEDEPNWEKNWCKEAQEEIDLKFVVGTIRMKDIANIKMLKNAERESTRIIFLDCIDPESIMGKFPRELFARYKIVANYREKYDVDPPKSACTEIHLPITVIPKQLPKLVSSGIAMTPYTYDKEEYRFSEKRQKFVWFEFDEAPLDKEDTYFARVLSYSPDPYLCRIDQILLENNPIDLEFTLNKEKIRSIINGMDNDYAGIGIMQEMIPEIGSNGKKRYILPIPEGLHADSDELFGFYAYEIRVGHNKNSWSTAQGRYGRPLKVNGVQHSAPELVCNAYRSETNAGEKFIEISAPHATAVLNGKNVSAFPPNTSLWYLLYTQVMQADGKSYRNILIASDVMKYEFSKSRDERRIYDKESGDRLGIAKIAIREIGDRLVMMGLPRNSSLSVVAVEMFPMENSWQFVHEKLRSARDIDSIFANQYIEKKYDNPLIDNLGQYRIYRSSTLTPINEVCCEDC